MEVQRMWEGGLLRQFSAEPFKGSIPVVSGHAGAYVCDVHGHVTPPDGEEGGVRNHDGRWLCSPCGERHEQAKVRMARLFCKTLKSQPNSGVLKRNSVELATGDAWLCPNCESRIRGAAK